MKIECKRAALLNKSVLGMSETPIPTTLKRLTKAKILVIGESILDEYVAYEAGNEQKHQ